MGNTLYWGLWQAAAKTSLPPTGDSRNPWLWAALCVFAVACAAGIAWWFFSKRRK